MKKGLVSSYVSGIRDLVHGERFTTILWYFAPEYVTSLLLLAPSWLDAYFIGHLKSTAMYGTVGATNNLVHLLIKVAEAFSVGTIVLSGKYNGRGDFLDAGRALRHSFWVTCILGGAIASALYFGAHFIYTWYVPAEMVALGASFLQLRAVGIFLMFLFFAIAGFLRGIKNTKAPMYAYILGTVVFLFLDYSLIFGAFGLPALGLKGSALASVTQYGVMLAFIIGYIMVNPRCRKYSISLFATFSEQDYWKELISLSVPVIIDKATLAFAYLWLCALMKPLGVAAVATFSVLKDMERFSLVPAIAFAQIVTLLVSNDYGIQNWDGIKSNIKKIVFMASGMVMSILIVLSYYAREVVQWFDRTGDFTDLAARVFPIISVLVFFDVLQLILSGALRGSANVRLVMMVRLIICIGYFVPVSYLISRLPIADPALKLILIYSSFYIGNALMSIIYINRFRSEAWKTH